MHVCAWAPQCRIPSDWWVSLFISSMNFSPRGSGETLVCGKCCWGEHFAHYDERNADGSFNPHVGGGGAGGGRWTLSIFIIGKCGVVLETAAEREEGAQEAGLSGGSGGWGEGVRGGWHTGKFGDVLRISKGWNVCEWRAAESRSERGFHCAERLT